MPELGTSGSAGGPGWAIHPGLPNPGPAAQPRMSGWFCDAADVVVDSGGFFEGRKARCSAGSGTFRAAW